MKIRIAAIRWQNAVFARPVFNLNFETDRRFGRSGGKI
jgi:hypothetical protein